jgi:hypothetical protein
MRGSDAEGHALPTSRIPRRTRPGASSAPPTTLAATARAAMPTATTRLAAIFTASSNAMQTTVRRRPATAKSAGLQSASSVIVVAIKESARISHAEGDAPGGSIDGPASVHCVLPIRGMASAPRDVGSERAKHPGGQAQGDPVNARRACPAAMREL